LTRLFSFGKIYFSEDSEKLFLRFAEIPKEQSCRVLNPFPNTACTSNPVKPTGKQIMLGIYAAPASRAEYNRILSVSRQQSFVAGSPKDVHR
jgi:hypothetical protein